MMKKEPDVWLVRISVKMINPLCIEQARAALNAVHDIALLEQKLSKVSAILSSDSCDQGDFGVVGHAAVLHDTAARF